MDKFGPLVRRWWHCLVKLHRPMDVWNAITGQKGRIIGCACGEVFYNSTTLSPGIARSFMNIKLWRDGA